MVSRCLILMEIKEEKPVLKCDNIVISPRGIAETHGNKVVLFVPAADIDGITLKFGNAEHRPVVSLSIGVVLALIGLFGLFEFFTVPRGYRYELAMMALGAFGVSIIFDSLKQRYFLEVNKKKDVCRLIFSKHVQKKEIDDFCVQVTAQYNWQIVDDACKS